MDRKQASIAASPGGVAPEQVVVFETAVPVQTFVESQDATPGLEWLLDQEVRGRTSSPTP